MQEDSFPQPPESAVSPLMDAAGSSPSAAQPSPTQPSPLQPPVASGSRWPVRPGIWPGRALWLLLLVFLIAAWVLPYAAQHLSYSIALGRLRAESQVARDYLAEGRPISIADYRWIVKAVEPSVVGVRASRIVEVAPRDPLSAMFGEFKQYPAQNEGSGVVIDAEGYIVTNYHVIRQASQVEVDLADGRVVPATIVGADKMSDIAVLKIQADGLVAAPWGDSDKLDVGDPVLAIGNPFRLMRTVTAGIISATGRHEVIQDLSYQDLLQTDAAVNPGNSGGPLVNMQGHVVGINTAIVGQTYQGIGFAIPSNLAKKVCQMLKSSGKVSWGWLGVAAQSLTPDQAKQAGLTDSNGALVTAVVPDSPAAAVGIKPGDIIVRWNDRATNDPMELVLAVTGTEPGSTATVELIRDGKKKTITVEVRERPAQAG